MFQTGEIYRSDVHDAVVVVVAESGGSVRYAIVDKGSTTMDPLTTYLIAATTFKEWYVDNGSRVYDPRSNA